MGMDHAAPEPSAAVVAALPAWLVLIIQFNDNVAREMGVTPSDLQGLFVLSRLGPSTPGTIAKELALNTGSASRLVDRLVAAGLVTRDSDPSDRRRVLVAAKPSALDRVAQLYTPMNDRLKERLDELPAGTLAEFLSFVRDAEVIARALVRGA